MAKRKAPADVGLEDAPLTLRRSTRRTVSSTAEAPAVPVSAATSEPPKERSATKSTGKAKGKANGRVATRADVAEAGEGGRKHRGSSGTKRKESANPTLNAKGTSTARDKADADEAKPSGRQYWLMKAEPEPREENGVNVAFSIDDLAAKTEPEPWDGIRAYPARNNLRAMKKGDLAFFYHSNCKTPGIVGVMEIVREHSPDSTHHSHPQQLQVRLLIDPPYFSVCPRSQGSLLRPKVVA